MEEEGPTTTTVVTKVPSTEVTTGDVMARLEVVDISEVEKVDEVVEVLDVEDEREVVADVEVGEDDVVDKVDVGVVDVGVAEVVAVPGSGIIWAFVLIEKRRSTRTKVFISGVGREGATRQQIQNCHSWSHLSISYGVHLLGVSQYILYK